MTGRSSTRSCSWIAKLAMVVPLKAVSTLLYQVICVNTILRSLAFRCAKYFFLRCLTPGPQGQATPRHANDPLVRGAPCVLAGYVTCKVAQFRAIRCRLK